MTLGVDVSIRNAWADQFTTRAGNGALLRLYDGSRPATGGTATTKLAELTCGTPFGTTTTGVHTLSAITQDSSADATGTATWFRIVKSDGTTFVMDGSVGTSGQDLNLNTVAIVAGAVVSISSFTITSPHA